MAWVLEENVLEGNVLECYVSISLGSCQISIYYLNFFSRLFL